jgi:hypothetical protein
MRPSSLKLLYETILEKMTEALKADGSRNKEEFPRWLIFQRQIAGFQSSKEK